MSRSWRLGICGIGLPETPRITLQDVQRIQEVRFFDEIRNGRIEVNVIHVTKVVASNRWEVAVNLIQQMMDEGIAADRICYNALVNACSDHRWQISLKLQKKIDTRGFSAMMAYARDMSWRKVHEVLQNILDVCMQVDIVTGNAALTALDKAKRWEGALQCLREALHEVDSFTFTSSISACAALGTWQRAGILLEEMSWTRVLWDVRTLNSVLLACQRGQLWRGCIALVEAMLASTLRLDEATLNAVSAVGDVSSEPRAQPWQTSLQQLCSWWQTGAIRLFPLSLSSTLRVCEASNQWAVAAQLFGASKSATHPAYHPSIFNAMTLTANGSFGWQGTLHVLDMMNHISCRPNIISFNSLLGVCEKCLAWERALDFTVGHQMFGASKMGKRSFDAILSASTKTAAWTMANFLLEDGGLLESRVVSDLVSLHLVMAISTWTRAIDLGSKLCGTLTTSNAVLGAEGLLWHLALAKVQEMLIQRLEADSVTYTSALDVSKHHWVHSCELLKQIAPSFAAAAACEMAETPQLVESNFCNL